MRHISLCGAFATAIVSRSLLHERFRRRVGQGMKQLHFVYHCNIVRLALYGGLIEAMYCFHFSTVSLLKPVPIRPVSDGRVQCLREAGMPTGTVKWFNSQKGFGFVEPDDGSKDIFVHISAVEQAGMTTLTEGQKLHFEIEDERRGPKAVDLRLAD